MNFADKNSLPFFNGRTYESFESQLQKTLKKEVLPKIDNYRKDLISKKKSGFE